MTDGTLGLVQCGLVGHLTCSADKWDTWRDTAVECLATWGMLARCGALATCGALTTCGVLATCGFCSVTLIWRV